MSVTLETSQLPISWLKTKAALRFIQCRVQMCEMRFACACVNVRMRSEYITQNRLQQKKHANHDDLQSKASLNTHSNIDLMLVTLETSHPLMSSLNVYLASNAFDMSVTSLVHLLSRRFNLGPQGEDCREENIRVSCYWGSRVHPPVMLRFPVLLCPLAHHIAPICIPSTRLFFKLLTSP
jgi:hypothetical protein